MAAPQSDAFQQAVIDSKKLTKPPTSEELLELYALFKVSTGEDIKTAAAPGLFDLKGKAKRNAWRKVVDEGISAEEAQERYVALVEKLKVTYAFDPNKEPEAVGSS